MEVRSRADILGEIEKKAPYYTPEWRYNADKPDAGTALGFIWADMFSETCSRLDMVPETSLRSLLNAMGAKRRPAAFAEGILTFFAIPGLEGHVDIPVGTRILASDGGASQLQTTRGITLQGAGIAGVYEASGEPDCVSRVGGREGARLFSFSGKNERSWSFEHPFAFDVSGGGCIRVRIDCGGDTESAASALTGSHAVWEMLSPDGWRAVTAARHGGDILLHRDGGEAAFGLRFHIVDPHAFSGVHIRSVLFLPQNLHLKPDAVYSGDIPVTDSGFFPFGERFMVYDTVCFSCDEALGKPGALIELSFSVRIIKTAIEGFPRPEQEWKAVMRPSEIIKIEEREISVLSVSWEYFNGTGWNALPVDKGASDIFKAGETPEPRVIRFICPDDFESIAIGASDSRFLRARVLSIENGFSMYGYYLSPWVENPRFSYTVTQGIPPTRTVAAQNMEEREFSGFSESPALTERTFDEPAVYFEMTRSFRTGTILWLLKENLESAPALRWEYMAETGWEPLDTEDGTANFRRTGILSYNAPLPPAKTRLFGTDAHWIRAVLETRPIGQDFPKPEITGIFENSAPAIAVAPGAEANRGRGEYTVIASPVAGVAGATNPLPVTGGIEAETDMNAQKRLTRAFSHGNRAVSRWDIECLAMESSPDIIKCRCVPNAGADGKRHARDICLILFSRSKEFEALSGRVGRFISSRSPLSQGRLHIVRPQFAALNVGLTATVDIISSVFAERERILLRLKEFLDPETGYHGGGWSFGELPDASQIQNALMGLGTIKHVDELRLTYSLLADGRTADYRELRGNPFILPENGEHEVILCLK